MNPGMCIKLAGLLLVVAICYAPEAAVAQPGPAPREIVRAGPATLQVTVSGKGEPIVFIPSRGRSIDDFDNLSKRLGPRSRNCAPSLIGFRRASLNCVAVVVD